MYMYMYVCTYIYIYIYICGFKLTTWDRKRIRISQMAWDFANGATAESSRTESCAI